MLETPHVAVGAAIAAQIPNPLISIPLALGSHFLLDMLPHWNPHLFSETKKFGKPTRQSTILTATDVGIALVLGSTVAASRLPDAGHALTILLASFASVIPDVVEGPYFWLKLHSKAMEKWIGFQRSIQNDVPIIPGLSMQFFTLLAAVLLAFV